MRRRSRIGRLIAGIAASLLAFGGVVAVTAEPAAAAGQGRLSLFKRIENLDTGASFGDRGAWDVKAVNVRTGATIQGQGLNGVQSVVVEADDYVISELANANTPAGYRFEQWDCGTLGVFTEPEPTITVADGASVTCTVENVAIQSNLQLDKVVEGGSADPDQWTLSAQGQTPLSGTSGVNANVKIGQYVLSESGGPSGYTASDWVCHDSVSDSDLPVQNSTVTIELNQRVVCTITNSGGLPQLTLSKTVASDGPLPVDEATDWTLSAVGPSGTVSGSTGTPDVTNVGIAAGDWTLAETGPTGYDAGAWACTDRISGQSVPVDAGGALQIGENMDVECAIVNTFTGGWLTLVKEVDGAQPPIAWTLTATGPDAAISGRTGMPAITERPVPAGTYTLQEAGLRGGYETDGWTCTNRDGFGETVAVALGEAVTCTIRNVAVRPHLTLEKTVVNTGGGPLAAGDWNLSASGPTDFNGPGGSDDVSFVEVEPGEYTLSETSNEPEAGDYTASEWACTVDGTGENVSTGPDTVTVPDGDESVTCRIVNTWTRSTLTLVKRVIAALGNAAAPSEWTLTAVSGAERVSGASGSPEATGVDIPGGLTWDLSEAGPSGYTPSGWGCTGGVVNGSQVTVPPGTDAQCAITNAAIDPTITLVKNLVPGAGSTAEIDDFVLKTRGPGNAAFAGVSGSPEVTDRIAPPGEYVFSEDGGFGFDQEWSCTGTTFNGTTAFLAYGEHAVCTVTNTPIAPTLSLVKMVDNRNGGDLEPADWTLTATGPSGELTGDGEVPPTIVDAGRWTLAESSSADGAADYARGNWICRGTGFQTVVITPSAPQTFSLPLGVDVTCTITNTYDPPRLTLVKEVDNGLGPANAPGNWVLSATDSDGAAVIEAPGGDDALVDQVLTSGSYDLAEATNPADPPTNPGDYGATGWLCDGRGFSSDDLDGSTLALQGGDDVTCTVINVFDPPRLTLVKATVGGGPLEPEDWTLVWEDEADPAHAGSGTNEEAGVTRYPVGVGSYRLSEETDAPEAVDYAPGEWTCTGGGEIEGDVLTLDTADVLVTCVIVNRYDPPVLTLVKDVAGGPNTPADWVLSATGTGSAAGTSVSGPGDSDAVLAQQVVTGSYDLAEAWNEDADPASTDYVDGDWTCEGDGVQTGDSIALTRGETAVCTVVNTYDPPLLTLVKQVAGGGPLTATDWNLTWTDTGTPGHTGTGATGSEAVTAAPVGSGAYDLSEASAAAGQLDYEPGDWTCEGGTLDGATITLAFGEDATCTIVNTYDPPVLTLVKEVDNGPEPPRDVAANRPGNWLVSATGSGTAAGTEVRGPGGSASIVGQTVTAGEYALGDQVNVASPPAQGPDYAATAWACDGGTLDGANLILSRGEDVTCTVVNVFDPPRLTLVKQVEGGALEPAAWELSWTETEDPTRTGTGVTGDTYVTRYPVGTGSFELAESSEADGAADYVAGAWSCDDGELDGDVLTLTGDEVLVTCTVVNRYDPPVLTLVKDVAGGPNTPADWVLSATGTGSAAGTSVSGPGDSDAVLAQQVVTGSYDLAEAWNEDAEPASTDYVDGDWTCTGGELDGATLDLTAGEEAVCTVVNTYDPPVPPSPTPTPVPPSGCPDCPGDLAGTGVAPFGWLLAGFAAVGAGILFLGRRRRRG